MNDLKRINLLTSEINGIFHDASAALGLTDSASIILYTLWESGGSCLLSQIVRMSGISKQTINSALRKLEGQGLVLLEAVDHRRKQVTLTHAGSDLARRTVAKLIDAENRIYASWPREELETYIRLTQRYVDQLKEEFKEIV